jgi:septum formation protein
MHAIYRATMDIVLASASPRRLELLRSLGIDFRVAPSTCPEPPPEDHEKPEAYAMRMALQKAQEVAALHPQSLVIGADTVVAVGGEILGKPVDEADARRMLGLLAGREHLVATGCALVPPDGPPSAFAVGTRVTMIDPGPAALAAYAATGEPLDKAGAYAIQGQGAFLVRSVEGSYTNVVGLPLAEVLEALLVFGALEPARD